jgi:phospho-N-acetylmuramoyl-pentapeptide-transferase
MARFALMIASLVGFLVTAAASNLLVPALQRIRAARLNRPGAAVPAAGRAAVPSPGGIAPVLGTLAAVGAAWMGLSALDAQLLDGHQRLNLVLALAGAVGFAAVGFFDDYLREVLGRRRGLAWWQNALLQCLVLTGLLAGLRYAGSLDTGMVIPFVGYVALGRWYYVLLYPLTLLLLDSADAADGLDGLSACLGFLGMLGCTVVCGLLNSFQLSVYGAAAAGSLLGFLLWNFYPARVLPGRTGSYFAAGSLVAVTCCLGWPSLLVLLGAVWALEGLAAAAQALYFRAKMLPRAPLPLHALLLRLGWSPLRTLCMLAGAGGVCTLLAMLFVRVS